MNRRTFLKLACTAVVAPSLPLATSKPEEGCSELIYFITMRMQRARQALLDDLEASALLFNSGPKGINNLSIPGVPGWIKISMPIKYNKQ